jgi:hypothetical protein
MRNTDPPCENQADKPAPVVTTGTMTLRVLYLAVQEALDSLPALDRGDACWEVDQTIDRIIDVLRDDPRFPKLTRLDYELLFADVRRDAEETLTELIDGKTDAHAAAEEIVRAIIDEAACANEEENEQKPRAARS